MKLVSKDWSNAHKMSWSIGVFFTSYAKETGKLQWNESLFASVAHLDIGYMLVSNVYRCPQW